MNNQVKPTTTPVIPQSAFSPLYSDVACLRGNRPDGTVALTPFPCLVFGADIASPLSENSTASIIRTAVFCIPVQDWPFPKPPQTGDRIEWNNMTFRAETVSNLLDDYRIDARETTK